MKVGKNLGWRQIGVVLIRTHLAIFVVAPAPEFVIGFGGTPERVASADASPIVIRANLYWGCSIGVGSVAELNSVVVAPTP